MSQEKSFQALSAQLDALRQGDAVTCTAGHRDLAPEVWLSTDPAGNAGLTCRPGQDGIVLSLSEGDSGAWACLGMRLPLDELARARFLGLLVAPGPGDLVSMRPTLRYFHDDGMHDAPTAAPILLNGGGREVLAHIPLDADRLASAGGCELNLFFHTDRFEIEFTRLEPVLIL